MNDIFSTLGFKAADILLPKEGIDCEKWAVVACDQYTSQEEYWESLSEYVGDSPSTLRLIYQEVFNLIKFLIKLFLPLDMANMLNIFSNLQWETTMKILC